MALVVKDIDISPNPISDLSVRRTVCGENLMITRYEVEAGAKFAAHRHPEEQMGYVIRGCMEFFVGEPEKRHLFETGTFFHFAPNEQHRSRVLEDSLVIDVFAPPRPEYVPEAAREAPNG
jgi:quercetin dioxygenase-like cupin family protein